MLLWVMSLRYSGISVTLRVKIGKAMFFQAVTARAVQYPHPGTCVFASIPDPHALVKMATLMLGGKKLADLRVVDLRQELEIRGLEKSGVKAVLVERLQKARSRNRSTNYSCFFALCEWLQFIQLSDLT